MKVIQLVSSFRSGGIERLLLQTLEPLRARGVDSTVVSLTNDLARADILRRKGFRVVQFHEGFKNIRHNFLPSAEVLSSVRHLKHDEQPALIHAHHTHAIATAWALSRWMKVPYVVTNHNLNEPWQRESGFWPYVFRFLMRRSFTGASHIFCISAAVKEDLEKHLRRRMRNASVLENCVDDAFWDIPIDTPRKVDVAFIGRLQPQKNPIIAVKTLIALSRDHPEIRSVMVGSGEFAKEVTQCISEAAAQNSVSALGELSEADVLKLLADTKVVFLPSLWEGFGIAAAEGLAAGCSCVLSTSPGFVRTYNGIVGVSFADPTNLQDNLEGLKSALVSYVPTKRDSLRARFGIEHYVDSLARSYRTALKTQNETS